MVFREWQKALKRNEESGRPVADASVDFKVSILFFLFTICHSYCKSRAKFSIFR